MECCKLRGVPEQCLLACGKTGTNPTSRFHENCIDYQYTIKGCESGSIYLLHIIDPFEFYETT